MAFREDTYHMLLVDEPCVLAPVSIDLAVALAGVLLHRGLAALRPMPPSGPHRRVPSCDAGRRISEFCMY